MSFDLILFPGSLFQKQAVSEILKCNEITRHYMLTLTQQQAAELVETRSLSLRDTGRIEFGGGIIDRIIKEFCSSPYIWQDNYAQTLNDLIEIFYYYKNETLDMVSDHDLIKIMKKCFDGECQGSLDLLKGRTLDRMARSLRYGCHPEFDGTNNRDTEENDHE